MPRVHLTGSIRQHAGGLGAIEVGGDTAPAPSRRWRPAYPALRGWVIDEQGVAAPSRQGVPRRQGRRARCADWAGRRAAHRRRHLRRMRHDRIARRHQEGPDRPASADGARPSRSPPARSRARSRSSPCAIPAPAAISRASRTASSARTSIYTDDPSGKWEQADGPAFPASAGAAVERIWVIEPGVGDGELWCGVAPAALFRSGDGGKSWALVQGLWDVPERPHWNPGAGGMCLNSICPWPGDAEAPGRQHLCRRRLADRRRRQELAARRQGPGAALSARGGARTTRTRIASTHRARAAPALDPLHAVPRRRLSLRRRRRDAGPTSAPGAVCPPTSASRSPSTPTNPDRAFVIPLSADMPTA